MKAIVIGVKRMRGIGKESGKAFDFAQCEVLTPMNNVSGEKFNLTGLGYETSKLDMKMESLSAFNDVKFPATLDLVIEHEPGRNGMKAVVAGITAAAPGLKSAA